MFGSLPPLADITFAEAATMRGELIRAIATGALIVRAPDGTSVTYRSTSEMQGALDMLEKAMMAPPFGPAVAPRPNRFYFTTSKGL